MKLTQQVKRRLMGHRFFQSEQPIVVAVSTGVDSMVLLAVLEQLGLTKRLVVAHVNHELRPQSQAEEAFLNNYCQTHHLKLVVKHWSKNLHPTTGIENAARQMRYAFFKDVMAEFNAPVLMTAHHANDQAETMLMNLVRGGQLTSLAGISDVRDFGDGMLIRPLLKISKADLIKYGHEHQLTWFEDETNTDLTITRNRYRHELLPALIKENPQVINHFVSWHEQLTTLLAFSQHQLQKLLKTMTNHQHLQLVPYLKQPDSVRLLLLQTWLQQNHVHDLTQAQLQQLDQLLNDPLKPNQTVALPQNYQLVKSYREILVKNGPKLADKPQKNTPAVVELGKWYKINDELSVGAFLKAQVPSNIQPLAEFKLTNAAFPLKLRLWQATDRLRLKGGGHQTVRRVLINAKVPAVERKQQLVLTTADGEVLWVIGQKFAWLTWPNHLSPTDYQTIVIAQQKS